MTVEFSDALFSRAGLAGRFHAHRWGAESESEAEDLAITEINEDLFAMGHKRLMPPEALKEIKSAESKGRRIMRTGFKYDDGESYFHSTESVERVDAELRRIRKEEYAPALARFVENYPLYRDQMIVQWQKHVDEFAEKIPERDRNRWKAETMNKIVRAYPSQEDIAHRFGFSWKWKRILSPNFDSFPVSAQTESERNRLRKEMIEEYQGEVREFLENAAKAMRREASAMIREWTVDLATNGSVHHSRVRALRNFIQRFRTMNFMDDAEFSRQLDSIERVLPEQGSISIADDIGGQIQNAMAAVKAAADELNVPVLVDRFLSGGRSIEVASDTPEREAAA